MCEDSETQKQKKDSYAKMEPESGRMLLQGKGCLGYQKLKEAKKDPFLDTLEKI